MVINDTQSTQRKKSTVKGKAGLFVSTKTLTEDDVNKLFKEKKEEAVEEEKDEDE
ncbi:MAG: hypothetical protein MJ252_12360 [archaeon]|nr:hypothetical protein [archaeon]